MDYGRLDAYDYDLPAELIAAEPAAARSASRLMIGGRGRAIRHETFNHLSKELRRGDLLVFNDTRVVAARIRATKSTGGRVELFAFDVLSPAGPQRWTLPAERITLRCMTRASKPLRAGTTLDASGTVVTLDEVESGFADVTIQTRGESAEALLARLGEIPLPPYIVRRREELGAAPLTSVDSDRYQTVYARAPGAVAAPTAGLHFDAAVFDTLDDAGIERVSLTLDVGPGTFRPVTAERLDDHEMHVENYEIPTGLDDAIARTRARGGRIVAVGTTTVRTLEAEARRDAPFSPGRRGTNLFIRPGFEFEVVDAMITNFHLPRSTLLALVYAFGGPEEVRRMYEVAIAARYRFYSYGDAMLLWRAP